VLETAFGLLGHVCALSVAALGRRSRGVEGEARVSAINGRAELRLLPAATEWASQALHRVDRAACARRTPRPGGARSGCHLRRAANTGTPPRCRSAPGNRGGLQRGP